MSPAANIVDSHVHFWDPARLRNPWLDSLPELNRAFLPADFAVAGANAGLTKMIFVEGGCEPSQSLAEVDWISALAGGEPRLCGIVAHAPVENNKVVEAHLEQLAARPLVKGVRRLLQGERDPEFCLHSDFVAGVKRLAEFQYTFDLCIRPEQLPSVTELVRRAPGIQFVLDHCGKPPIRAEKIEPWATDLRMLATLSNVSCKISGLTTEADWQGWRTKDLKPYVDTVLESFGFDRVLFGGDWPVCTVATNYQRWLETIWELTSSADAVQRTKLFQTNAERIYRV
jgi:L-fuconolactonase